MDQCEVLWISAERCGSVQSAVDQCRALWIVQVVTFWKFRTFKAKSKCKNHERRVTDVHLICITSMFENEESVTRGLFSNWTKSNVSSGGFRSKVSFSNCALGLNRYNFLIRKSLAKLVNFRHGYIGWLVERICKTVVNWWFCTRTKLLSQKVFRKLPNLE